MVQSVDQQAVDTIRVLAADMTRGANSGHPGAPMGCAPMANVLFSKYLNGNFFLLFLSLLFECICKSGRGFHWERKKKPTNASLSLCYIYNLHC